VKNNLNFWVIKIKSIMISLYSKHYNSFGYFVNKQEALRDYTKNSKYITTSRALGNSCAAYRCNIASFIRHYYTIRDISNKNLGAYLSGLIESDGYIFCPSTEQKGVPHIEIVFDIKDIQLFTKIKEVLGAGYITIRPNSQSGRLFIKKRNVRRATTPLSLPVA
jgi:hypothetical protein